jgi:Zn-finger nucleic acid-binding protein
MKCPNCKADPLLPGSIEPDLPAYTCGQCAGALLSLSPYIGWSLRQPQLPQLPPPFEPVIHDSRQALLCPKCSRVMVKFKVLADAVHNLDFCFNCEEVWLDAGEWDYLRNQNLQTHITAISTDTWQRKLREQVGAHIRAEKFKESIGAAAFPQVEQFGQWLHEQPDAVRDEVLRYLGQAIED